MIGTFQKLELTHGSFGHQYTTIDGQVYVTWFDLRDPKLRGLSAGARVEFEARARVLQLCDIVNPLLKGVPVRKPADQAADIEAMVSGLSEELERNMLKEIYGGRDAGGARARRGRMPKWSDWEI